MKILTLILLALAGGIHWLRSNPNRDASGRYRPNNVAERFGVYVVLAVVAVLVLGGCARPDPTIRPAPYMYMYIEEYTQGPDLVRVTHTETGVRAEVVP